MKKSLLLTLLGTLFFCFAFAQSATDKIIKTDGTEIICHVKKVGSTEIEYTKADNPDGPVYTISKTEVRKIVFANGTEEVIQQNTMSVTPSKNRNYKRAITTRPFGPLFQFISVGYQQALSPSRAIIGEVGYVGPTVGSMWSEDPTGGFIKVGFRLKRTPEIVMQGMEWGYNLGGFYFQPELAFSSFNVTETYSTYNNQTGQYVTTTSSNRYNSGALLLGLGRQMIVGEIVTIDLGAAVGYGTTSKPTIANSNNWDLRTRYYSHNMFGNDFPLAWKFTFAVGILLK